MTADIPARTDVDVEALIAAATPGPWEIYRYGNGGGRIHVSGDDGRKRELIADIDPDGDVIAYGEGDREFLFAARDLVPSLLARAQKAEARVSELTADCDACVSCEGDTLSPDGFCARCKMADDAEEIDLLSAELAAAKAENERLRSCDCAASKDGNPHHQSFCRSLPTSTKRDRHALLAENYAGLVARERDGNDLARKLADALDGIASARAEVEDWQEKWRIVDADRCEAQAERDAAVANSDALSVENAALRAQVQAVEALRQELLAECDAFAPPDTSFETGFPEINPEFWVRVRSIHDRLGAALASAATPEPTCTGSWMTCQVHGPSLEPSEGEQP